MPLVGSGPRGHQSGHHLRSAILTNVIGNASTSAQTPLAHTGAKMQVGNQGGSKPAPGWEGAHRPRERQGQHTDVCKCPHVNSMGAMTQRVFTGDKQVESRVVRSGPVYAVPGTQSKKFPNLILISTISLQVRDISQTDLPWRRPNTNRTHTLPERETRADTSSSGRDPWSQTRGAGDRKGEQASPLAICWGPRSRSFTN